MKKTITLLILLGLITTPALAYNFEVFDETNLGAKVNAPNLFVQKGSHSLGAEATIYDITEDWKDGSEVLLTYTFTGSIFNLDRE